MENINESKNNDFFNSHKSTPLLKPNILNLQQVKIQMKFNDINHYSVKTLKASTKKEEKVLYIHRLLLKVKYKLKSNTKCTEKLMFHFVCEQNKVVFTL